MVSTRLRIVEAKEIPRQIQQTASPATCAQKKTWNFFMDQKQQNAFSTREWSRETHVWRGRARSRTTDKQFRKIVESLFCYVKKISLT